MTKALAATIFAALLLVPAAATHAIKEGGTFRVAATVGSFDTIDPALYSVPASASILRPACSALMGVPDEPLPEGLRLRPELAEADPVVSRNGKTYTFTIRQDARFSNGTSVTARDLQHALERILAPAMRAPQASIFLGVVGADDVQAGRTNRLAGVVAEGRTLTIRLTKRVGDFPLRMTGVCAVPASLPTDPEGAKAPLPSAAPYYVAQYVPNQLLVLERNRFYKGTRAHHVDRFTVNLASDAEAIFEGVATGKLDWGWVPDRVIGERSAELAGRYGVNKSQFFSSAGFFLRMFAINTSRPLFAKNPKLRQAVNFAVDRRALGREFGPLAATITDQYLPPLLPSFIDERIYPRKGPDLARAKALANGHRRGGTVVLYLPETPTGTAQGQIMERNLRAIGLDVEIKSFPQALLFEKLATRGEPFDIGWIGWGIGDGSGLGDLFDGRRIAEHTAFNYSYFNSPKYNRLIDAASRLPLGPARDRAWGELDVSLSRNAAPGIPYAVTNAFTFVSARTGCVVRNPYLDLTAVCLK